MFTVEAAYVFGAALMVILTLITGAIDLHEKINSFATEQLESEIANHTMDEPKTFQPEDFIRSVTLFERNSEDEESEENDG